MLNHFLKAVFFEVGKIFVCPIDVKTEAGGEVFLVSDHHVHIFGDLLVHFLGLFLAADSRPTRGPVIEVRRDNHTVFPSGGCCFDDQISGAFAESGENSTRVEPAGALFSKNLIPIKIAWLQLRCGGVAAIRTSDCTADAEASLCKVQAVAHGPTDPIVSGPLQKRGIDPALENEIFH